MSSTPEEAIAALQPWIAKHRRTAWLPEVRTDSSSLSNSSFSGLPMLLPGEEWPLCKSCQAPMEMMLQLDLANLPTNRHGDLLLQLFYCLNGDKCEGEGGWEPFSDCVSLCRTINQSEAHQATENRNQFPTKTINGWNPIEDSPDSSEHECLGLKFDYHFNDVPFHPMEFWCPELDLHFVGSEYIEYLEETVTAEVGDKLGGWPNWVQGAEYPTCPQCGTEMSLLMQIDSEDNVPYMFGDCGIGHITQCPQHLDVVAFGWACS